MKDLQISIALASYNGARYISEQLDSFAQQSRHPDELVVCDDGSTDGTLEILDQFASIAPFEVSIRRNPTNLGYVRNFELAVSLCRGDIIFMSDQDDVWLPNKIERILEAFAARPDCMVVLNDQIITDEKLAPTGTTKLENMRRFGAPERQFVTGCCSAHRREWLSVVLPIPQGVDTHDRWINEAAHRLGTAAILDDRLQLYRRHGENASSGRFSSKRRVGPLDRAKERLDNLLGGRKPTSALPVWLWEGEFLHRLRERREQLADLGLGERAAAVIAALEARRSLVERRRQIWALPRVRRFGPILQLWRSRAYGQSSGWKSALSDLLRSSRRLPAGLRQS